MGNDTAPAAGQGGLLAALPARIPYIESLGVELLEMNGGRALARFTAQPVHTNSWGAVHGGVVMTLLDFTMAMAGRSAADDHARRRAEQTGASFVPGSGGNVTVEMKTSFMRPAKGRLTIRAECVQSGRSLSFCEAEVLDDAGKPVARATGTFMFTP